MKAAPTPDDVRKQLDEILSSKWFKSSRQRSAFLAYLIDQTLQGNTGFNQYAIGVEALGKGENFDPATDNAVRKVASETRLKLGAYYLRNQDRPVNITLPEGGYVPTFSWRSEESSETPSATDSTTDKDRNCEQSSEPASVGQPDEPASGPSAEQPGHPAAAPSQVIDVPLKTDAESPSVSRRLESYPFFRRSHLPGAKRIAQFAADFKTLLRHPIQFARNLRNAGATSISRSVFFSAAVFCLMWTAFELLPGFRLFPPRDMPVLAVCFQISALVSAGIWRIIGTKARYSRLFCAALYFQTMHALFVLTLGNTANAILESRATVEAAQSQSAALEQLWTGLDACVSRYDFKKCLDLTQPFGSGMADGGFRQAVYTWQFALSLIIGMSAIALGGLWTILFIRACIIITQPRSWILTTIAVPITLYASWGIGALMATSVGALAPRTNCEIDVPSVPTLNPGPVLHGSQIWCGDYPLIDASLGKDFSRSAEEREKGVVVWPGDVLKVELWLNNGANEALNPDSTLARNVRANVWLRRADPKTLLLNSRAYGVNTPMINSSLEKYGGDFKISMAVPASVEVVPGSACVVPMMAMQNASTAFCDGATGGRVALPDTLLTSWVLIGDILPGFRNAKFVRFTLAFRQTAPAK